MAPKRAASFGSRLCPTPKNVQAPPGEMRAQASQIQDSSQVHEPDVADLENKPIIVPGFTTYSNPAFEPSDIIGETKRVAVLGDSNGPRTQETSKPASKQVITPRGQRPTTSCAGNMSPRALFDNSSSCNEAVSSNVKKRARAGEDEVTRTTRFKIEDEKITEFLRSPAARVRSDGTREEYWLDVFGDELVKKFMEKKMLMEKGSACQGDAGSKGSPSLALRNPFVRTPAAASRSARTTSTPQGSAKKNLSMLLEAQK